MDPMPLVGTLQQMRSRVIEYHSQTVDSVSFHLTLTSAELDSSQSDTVDCHCYRWFVIQLVDDDHPISKLLPFMLDKAMRNAVGSLKTVRQLQKGDLLMEIFTAIQSHIIKKLDNLASWPVTASPYRTLNISKGVIKCAPLDCESVTRKR